MSQPSDRNLLVGILALQMDFVSRDQLLAAMHAWVLRKETPLEQILCEQQALTADTRALLQALVAKHLELHGNNPVQSLQALSSVEDLRDELQTMADPDVQATLHYVGSGGGASARSSSRHTSAIDAVCDQFVRAWRNGEQPRIEAYLEQVPSRAHDELLSELLQEEIHLRRLAGEAVSADDYRLRFPQHEAVVSRVFLDREESAAESTTGSARSSTPEGFRVGRRFRVIRPHAKGGLGEVFVARDTELNREVALKEIQLRYAGHDESRSRFLMEAEITGSLEHPGIVPVYGLGHYADGRPYYAMRFIKGGSLHDAIKMFHQQSAGTGDLTTGEVGVEFRKLLGRFVDVCEALEYAHSRGVLHRDLKPGNIMLGKYGETLVVDWGLAKVVGRGESHKAMGETTLAPGSGSDSSKTQMGSAIGTPVFMSPEQAAGRVDELGPATDVYSLGATLYQLLTGEPPFVGQDTNLIIQRVQAGDFVRPRELPSTSPDTVAGGKPVSNRRTIPASLEAICLKAMALQPGARYPSAAALAADVERYLADEPVTALREPLTVRTRRWVKRHQTLVGSTAAGLLVAVAGLSLVAGVTARKNAELARANSSERTARGELANALLEAEAKRQLAEESQQLAEKRANESRRLLYVGRMNLMQRHWDAGETELAINLLTQYGPESPDKDLRGFEWYYFDRMASAAMTTLQAHSGGITSMAFSPDGTRLATAGGFDKTIKLWDVYSGQETATLRGHSDYVTSVAFSHNGTRLASGSWDATIKLWDVFTGQETATLRMHADSVHLVAFSPDGARLASVGGQRQQSDSPLGNSITLCDVATGQETATLRGHSSTVSSMAFSPDGTRLASGSRDSSIKLWDVSAGQETASLQGHTSDVHSVVFSPDGSWLASVSRDNTIKLWNMSTGQETATLQGDSASVESVAFSPDGTHLVSSRGGHSIKLRDVFNGNQTTMLRRRSRVFTGVAFSPDGTRWASHGDPNSVKLWDASAEQDTTTLRYPTNLLDLYSWGYSVVFSRDGTRLAAHSHDPTIRLWDVSTGQETTSLQMKPDSYNGVAFDNDWTRLAAIGLDNTITLWNVYTNQETTTLQETAKLQGHSDRVESVAFSPDGTRLASGSRDKTIKLWDVATGRETATLEGHSDGVQSVVFSPDGTRLASGSRDKTIWLWDVATGRETAVLEGHSDRVESVVFSLDGTRLASGSWDKTIKLWDVATGWETATLEGHSQIVRSVVFSPDGARLASGSHDQTIKLWDVSAVQETATLRGHSGSVTSVAFSLDGMRLASSSYDGTIKIWDARPWTPEIRLDQQALCLVRSLLPQCQSEESLGAAIEQSKTFTPAAKQRALNLAPLFWRSRLQQEERDRKFATLSEANALNEESWKIICQPHRSMTDYRDALNKAQRAVEMSSRYFGGHDVLGIAQFRAGEYELALRSLKDSVEDSPHFVIEEMSCLAMTHHRLGHVDQASELLVEIREILQMNYWLKEEVSIRGFLREAEEMIDPQP